jgi:hypothetical protein
VGGLICVRQVVIENPVINSPFEEPTRHFRFDDEAHHCYRHRAGGVEEKLTGNRSPGRSRFSRRSPR